MGRRAAVMIRSQSARSPPAATSIVAVLEARDIMLVAEAEADLARRPLRAFLTVDHRPERQQDRNAADRQSRVVRRRPRRPATERLDDRFGLEPPSVRFVDLDAGGRRQPAFRRTSPRASSSPRRWVSTLALIPGQIGAKLGKASRPEHQFAQDQQRPPFADQFERMGGPASIIITASAPSSLVGYFF